MHLINSNIPKKPDEIEKLKVEKYTVELTGFELLALYEVSQYIGGVSDFRSVFSNGNFGFTASIPKILDRSHNEIKKIVEDNYDVKPHESGISIMSDKK